jgi:hypothetical protein
MNPPTSTSSRTTTDTTTKEEKEKPKYDDKRLEERACFICGQVGQRKREYPKKNSIIKVLEANEESG